MDQPCSNHSDKKSINICNSCKRPFCEDCLFEVNNLYYCTSKDCQNEQTKTENLKKLKANYLFQELPAKIDCPLCNEKLELEESERQQKKFICPTCKEIIDISDPEQNKEIKSGAIQTESIESGKFKFEFKGEGVDLFVIYFITGLIAIGLFIAFGIVITVMGLIRGTSEPSSVGSIFFIIITICSYILIYAFIFAFIKFRTYDFFYSNLKFIKYFFFFNGTFGEIFVGTLKAFFLFGILGGIYLGINMTLSDVAAYINFPILIVVYILTFLILQFAYYSSRKYRLSRIAYGRNNFLLIGDLKSYAKKSFVNGVKGVLSLGILLPLYFHRRFSMLYNNLRYGDYKFEYKGEDKEYLKIALNGFFLTVLTFGVYYFWWKPQKYNYYLNNLYLGELKFSSELIASDYFKITITNLLLVIFTFGIGSAWAKARKANLYISSTFVEGTLPNVLINVHDKFEKIDTTGEAVADYFGLGGLGLF